MFAAKCSNGQRKQLRASHDLIYHKVLICTVHVIIYTKSGSAKRHASFQKVRICPAANSKALARFAHDLLIAA